MQEKGQENKYRMKRGKRKNYKENRRRKVIAQLEVLFQNKGHNVLHCICSVFGGGM